MITAIKNFVVLLGLIQTSRFFCADFKKVNIVSSSSCHTVSNPAPNIGNCFQACVNIGRSLYMVSQHVLNKECVCRQLPLLTDRDHSAGEWKFFVRYTIIIIALDWFIDWIEIFKPYRQYFSHVTALQNLKSESNNTKLDFKGLF